MTSRKKFLQQLKTESPQIFTQLLREAKEDDLIQELIKDEVLDSDDRIVLNYVTSFIEEKARPPIKKSGEPEMPEQK